MSPEKIEKLASDTVPLGRWDWPAALLSCCIRSHGGVESMVFKVSYH